MRSPLLRALAVSALLLAASAVQAQTAAAPDLSAVAPGPAPLSIVVEGGQVWTGEAFEARPLYAEGGVFVETRPAAPDTVVQLDGQYVVPPFADAHTHMLDGPGSIGIEQTYVDQGIFYVMVLNNSAARVQADRPHFGAAETVDVLYSHGGFTSTGSHPALIYEALHLNLMGGGLTPDEVATAQASRAADGDAYWFVDTVEMLDEAWPRFLAQAPDVVKVFLLDAASGEPGSGLSPEVLTALVARATEAGLRVVAHVETAADVDLAIEAGVAGFAHLPGYTYRLDAERYVLSDATVAEFGRRGLFVTPTAVILPNYWKGRPARLLLAQDHQRRTIRRLLDAGGTIGLGADWWWQTADIEARYMTETGILSPTEMLQVWTEHSARSIFPERRIGRLAPGYEASLLVLACDPTEDTACTAQIEQRIKQGHPLRSLADATVASR